MLFACASTVLWYVQRIRVKQFSIQSKFDFTYMRKNLTCFIMQVWYHAWSWLSWPAKSMLISCLIMVEPAGQLNQCWYRIMFDYGWQFINLCSCLISCLIKIDIIYHAWSGLMCQPWSGMMHQAWTRVDELSSMMSTLINLDSTTMITHDIINLDLAWLFFAV